MKFKSEKIYAGDLIFLSYCDNHYKFGDFSFNIMLRDNSDIFTDSSKNYMKNLNISHDSLDRKYSHKIYEQASGETCDYFIKI